MSVHTDEQVFETLSLSTVHTDEQVFETLGLSTVHTDEQVFETLGLSLAPGELAADATKISLTWTAPSGGVPLIAEQIEISDDNGESWVEVAGGISSPALVEFRLGDRFRVRFTDSDDPPSVVYSNVEITESDTTVDVPPGIVSAIVQSSGLATLVKFTRAITGTNGFILDVEGGMVLVRAVLPGPEPNTLWLVHTAIYRGARVFLNYTPGDIVGVQDRPLEAFSGLPVANQSIATPGERRDDLVIEAIANRLVASGAVQRAEAVESTPAWGESAMSPLDRSGAWVMRSNWSEERLASGSTTLGGTDTYRRLDFMIWIAVRRSDEQSKSFLRKLAQAEAVAHSVISGKSLAGFTMPMRTTLGTGRRLEVPPPMAVIELAGSTTYRTIGYSGYGLIDTS